MLDDLNLIKNRDPQDDLSAASAQPTQTTWMAEIANIDLSEKQIESIVVTGMGGSALAASLIKSWLKFGVPFEVVRQYNLPAYVNEKTLVVVSSYSGSTEEALSALEDAEMRHSPIVIVASGGPLIDIAQEKNYPYVLLPAGLQPRLAVILDLRALTKVFEAHGLTSGKFDEIAAQADWLDDHSRAWLPEAPTQDNLAKQLAQHSAGKTVIIYSGSRMAPVGYKWKISFNENAKNLAFCNELSEFNHNEMLGWTSHPVDKPFVVFDLISGFEHPQVLKRFALSDQLLSGKRPKSIPVELQGESVIAQMLWGSLLADFVSIYLAILNNVDATNVDLLWKLKEKLKQ